MEALRSGQVDLVLLPDINISSEHDLASEPIYKEELLLASGAGYLPKSAEISPGVVRPESLSGLPFFLLFQEHAMRAWCDQWLRKNRIKVQPRMELSSNITCYRMAAAGLGVTIIPYLTTQLTTPETESRLYSLGESPVTWDVHLIYRKNAYLGQPELDLISIAKEKFSREQL